MYISGGIKDEWKIKVSIVTLLAAVLLAGCGNQSRSSDSKGNNQTVAKSAKPKTIKSSNETTFKNGTFENKNTQIKIAKTQVGHDNKAKKDGIIITFNITNKSKEEFPPSDALRYIKISQSNGKSDFDLISGFDSSEALYPLYNTDGSTIEDTEQYNAIIDKQNKFKEQYEDPIDAKLLPKKSITVIQGFELKDTKHPVYAKGYSTPYYEKEVGSPYKINLNK
ncbi:MAG: DUF5067 domain-containing protein [Lactobacillus sp.]|nr:DUF5067 domain-containing protein [Lactobacillus sp.]